MKNKKGFTLIELLVVVAIIALLLSILTPALNSVKERAKRILCKNRLRQWVIAIVAYNAANDNLMFIPRRDWWPWPGGGTPPNVGVPYPHYMGQRYDYSGIQNGRMSSGSVPGEWDIFRINPYIGAFVKNYDPFGEPQICGVTDLVACPNASGDFMTQWVTWNCEDEWDFTEPGYSYWVIGGMNPPLVIGEECSFYVTRDLTVDTLSPKRLLMSEILAIDQWGSGCSSPGNPYRYNHGRNGWSWFTADVIGHQDNDPFPQATGRSQAFGDGHVEWREISLKTEDNLPNTNDVGYCEDRWNGPGSGWMNQGDTSYY